MAFQLDRLTSETNCIWEQTNHDEDEDEEDEAEDDVWNLERALNDVTYLSSEISFMWQVTGYKWVHDSLVFRIVN